MVVASPVHTEPNPMVTFSNGSESEVVAAIDSKGTVHAAWVEHDDQSVGTGTTTLWYSTYGPESVSSRSTRRLDTYQSIYSLSMAIDNLDEVHMVWVRQSVNTFGTQNLTMTASLTSSRNAIYYQGMNPGRSLTGSPEPVLELQADAVWTSITAGRDSQLYIAWLSVVRSNSTDVESDVYYARLSPRDRSASLAGTLITRAPASARLLRIAASAARNDIHIAWVEEISDATSRVVDCEVNLAENTTQTVNVDEVRGRVSQLTLAAIQNGEVVLGWAYQESTGDNQATLVSQYTVGQNGISRVVEIPQKDAEVPESIAVDSQGNLHVVWAYPLEDAKAGPRPFALQQQSFRHAEYSNNGQLKQETREISYMPAFAAFVIGNGQLYVVSEQGMLQATDPVHTSNPTGLLFSLVILASLVGGVSTEPAVYLMASWWTDRSLRTISTDASEKLLRRIRKRPGIALGELKSATEPSEFSVASQLRALERTGMIRSSRDGRRQRFYCVVTCDRDESRAEELRRLILDLVDGHPGVAEAQIAKFLGVSQQLTNYHLRRLVGANLLLRFRCSDKIGYRVRDRALSFCDTPN
jgi:DNA-binding transcriptional ArsR family regulator